MIIFQLQEGANNQATDYHKFVSAFQAIDAKLPVAY